MVDGELWNERSFVHGGRSYGWERDSPHGPFPVEFVAGTDLWVLREAVGEGIRGRGALGRWISSRRWWRQNRS